MDCENGFQDGTETDIDCGGSCDPCEEGEDCENDSDCISDSCNSDICAAAEEEIPEETE